MKGHLRVSFLLVLTLLILSVTAVCFTIWTRYERRTAQDSSSPSCCERASSSSLVAPGYTTDWEYEEQRRETLQCSGAWQTEYAELQRWMRSDAVAEKDKRFLTFTCTPGKCGGIGDLLIGLVSSFVVAFVQSRALIVDYAWMDHGFAPNQVDWRLRDDVPMMPFQTPSKDAHKRRRTKQGTILYMNMHNQDPPDDVAAYFDSLAAAGNMRLLWNRGILVKIFTEEQEGARAWRKVLQAKGIRLSSAFGCILRFLIKVQPDVWDLVKPYMEQLHGPPHGTPTAAVGMHIRTSDVVSWNVEKVGEKVTLKKENVGRELRGTRHLFTCAQTLEDFFYSPAVRVTWLLFSSSGALKAAAKKEYGDKLLVTDIAPLHIELKVSDQERTSAFKTTVAEWILLARCCSHFIFTESGFSKTAALYSLQPLSMHMFARWADSWRDYSWRDRCEPESPTSIAVMGNVTRWSGI